MSKLLINEPPLQVLPTLAKLIGLNEAIFLQQLQYWLSNPQIGKQFEGEHWIRNSVSEWQETNFLFWSDRTIERILNSLHKLELIKSRNDLNSSSWDKAMWYTIDYKKLEILQDSAYRQHGGIESDNMAESTPTTWRHDLSETTSETTSSSALRTDEDLYDPDDPGDSDVYAELSGRTKNSIQDKNFVEFTDTDPAMYKNPKTLSRSLPNPTIVQPGFKNVPVVTTKPEPKRDTPPTDLEKYLIKHLANVAPNQWVRETSRLSAENREKLSKSNYPDTPEVLWIADPRFKEWVQDRGHWFIKDATKKNQNILVNLVCKYDTEEYGWYAWCDKHPKPLTLSPAEALKVELDNWVRAYYDPRKENGMRNVEDEQIHDRMVKAYQDALDNQVK